MPWRNISCHCYCHSEIGKEHIHTLHSICLPGHGMAVVIYELMYPRDVLSHRDTIKGSELLAFMRFIETAVVFVRGHYASRQHSTVYTATYLCQIPLYQKPQFRPVAQDGGVLFQWYLTRWSSTVLQRPSYNTLCSRSKSAMDTFVRQFLHRGRPAAALRHLSRGGPQTSFETLTTYDTPGFLIFVFWRGGWDKRPNACIVCDPTGPRGVKLSFRQVGVER